MSLFEQYLAISKEDIDFWLRPITEIWRSDFWLNPRRLRGSDFLMRWSQGVWSEKRLLEVVNRTEDFLQFLTVQAVLLRRMTCGNLNFILKDLKPPV